MADLTVTVTLHAWWLAVYLLVGVVLWVPLWYLAWRRSIHAQRAPFWRWLWVHADPLDVLIQVVAWPAAVWKAFR